MTFQTLIVVLATLSHGVKSQGIISMSNSAPVASVAEGTCQTTSVTVTTVTVSFTCVGVATGYSSTISVSPAGPANNCYDISTTTCGANPACGTTCTISVIVDPAAAGCTLDYEELNSTSFAYVVSVTGSAAAGSGANTLVFNVPVTDCNEIPQLITTAFNADLSEYSGTVTSYSGIVGNVVVRDPDVFDPVTNGLMTIAVLSVLDVNAASTIADHPFYFSPASTDSFMISTLMFDTTLCTTACLPMFDYSSPAPEYEVEFTVTDVPGLAVTSTYTITLVEYFDAPIFSNLPAIVTVGETDAGVLVIHNTLATNTNGLTVSFYLVNVDPTSGTTYFEFSNPITCGVTPPAGTSCNDAQLSTAVTSSTLNYYDVEQYNLTIWGVITTPAGDTVTSSSSLIVNVTLVNRQPVLTVASASLSIGEDKTVGECFWTITADDRESNPVLYDFLGTSPNTGAGVNFYENNSQLCFTDSFKENPCCGWIFDYNTQPDFTMSVRTYDAYSSLADSTFTFTVSLIYRNRPPVITGIENATMSIWECVSPGVANTLTATDPEDDSLSWIIQQPQTSENLMFSMTTVVATPSPSTATLDYSTPPPLNSTLNPVINLTAEVTDSQWTVSTFLQVNVLYCDTPPSFTNLAAITYIYENYTGVAYFFTASHYDKESDPFYYTFEVSGSISNTDGYFLIDPTTGQIAYNLSANDLDAYTTPSYTLNVLLINNPVNGPYNVPVTITSQLTIGIIPVNKTPYITMPTNITAGDTVSIYENASLTQTLYTFSAYDREGDTLFFNMSLLMPVWNPAFQIPFGLDYMEFNVQTANTTPILNYYDTPVYYARVFVYDSYNSPTSTTTLTISVLRVDRPPRWTSLPATVNVREDVTLSADLIAVGAYDPNIGLNYTVTITYLGITPTSGNSKFYYDSSTSIFGYNNTPNFSFRDQKSYQAKFEATNTIFTSTSYIDILIVEHSSPQSVSGTYDANVTLSESQTYASLIWDLRSVDNASLSLTYRLVRVTPGTSVFTVSADGLVRVQANPNLNYQETSRYILDIDVVNDLVPPSTTSYTLTVSISDAASQPSLTNLPNSVSLQEGMPGAGTVFSPICIDEDGLTLSYTGVTMPPAASGIFSVDSLTGAISTSSSSQIYYSSTPFIYIVLTCSNTYFSASQTLTVYVQSTGYWTSTESTSTTTTTSTTTESTCSSCLTTAQIAGIVGGVVGALILALIAFGLAKLMQRRATKDGTIRNIRQITPPSRRPRNYDYNKYKYY